MTSQISVTTSQISVMTSQISVMTSQISVTTSQISVMTSQISVMTLQISVGERGINLWRYSRVKKEAVVTASIYLHLYKSHLVDESVSFPSTYSQLDFCY